MHVCFCFSITTRLTSNPKSSPDGNPTTCTGGSDAFAAGDGGEGGVLYNAVRNYKAYVNKYGSPVDCWNVGAVTSFRYLFFNMPSFNELISSWETGQVIPHCTCITSYIILFENLIILFVIRSPT